MKKNILSPSTQTIMDNQKLLKLCPWSLAFTLGIIWAISTLSLTFLNYNKKPTLAMETIHQIYFNASPKDPKGKIILTVSAFFDAFIGGLFIGFIYNLFVS